mgnify:CR=1 FL=1
MKDTLLHKLNLSGFDYRKVEYLTGDASNRKYYKIYQKEKCNILMFDDGGKENIENFLLKTKIFKNIGIKTPDIFDSNSEQGIIILENFGNKKFSEILNKDNEQELYLTAMNSLIFLHKKKEIYFELFSKDYFFKEIQLFFDWYLMLIKKNISDEKQKEFKNKFSKLLNFPMKLPTVNLHRDFHVDNLFFFNNQTGVKKCGWIDYQDALSGSCVYDIMSLLEDARRDISKQMKNQLTNYYLESFKSINKDLFYLSFRVLAIQRHLKVLGIFSRLNLRDGKNDYLSHIPRVIKMLRSNLEYKEFTDIRNILSPLLGK